MDLINDFHPNIQFTYETEINKCLPFLDVEVKNVNGNLNFKIYRKPTNTERFITSDSHHSFPQKNAVFHSFIFRLLSIPMNIADFNEEKSYIYHMADVNGFPEQLIDNIFRRHEQKFRIRSNTTLLPESTVFKSISFNYFNETTEILKNIFKKYEINLGFKSTKIKTLLGNTKVKIN